MDIVTAIPGAMGEDGIINHRVDGTTWTFKRIQVAEFYWVCRYCLESNCFVLPVCLQLNEHLSSISRFTSTNCLLIGMNCMRVRMHVCVVRTWVYSHAWHHNHPTLEMQSEQSTSKWFTSIMLFILLICILYVYKMLRPTHENCVIIIIYLQLINIIPLGMMYLK